MWLIDQLYIELGQYTIVIQLELIFFSFLKIQDPGLLQSKRSLAVRWNQIWNQMLQSHYHFKQTKWFPLVVLLQPLHGMFLEWWNTTKSLSTTWQQFLWLLHSSMTTLLTHTVAHSTKPSFMPKANNQPPKKFLSLALSWTKVVKNWTSV